MTDRVFSFFVIVKTFILFTLAFVAFERNLLWKDDFSIWLDAAGKSPLNARPHNNLGRGYRDKGLLDDAIKEWRIALHLNPFYAPAHSNLGLAYITLDRFEDARKELMLALAYGPPFADLHNNLGFIYVETGFKDRAVEEFKKALAINPYYANARKNLAALYTDEGFRYGSIGNYREALEEFKKASQIEPDDPAAIYGLALTFEELNETSEAFRYWQKYLEKAKPGDPFVETAKGRIERLMQ